MCCLVSSYCANSDNMKLPPYTSCTCTSTATLYIMYMYIYCHLIHYVHVHLLSPYTLCTCTSIVTLYIMCMYIYCHLIHYVYFTFSFNIFPIIDLLLFAWTTYFIIYMSHLYRNKIIYTFCLTYRYLLSMHVPLDMERESLYLQLV